MTLTISDPTIFVRAYNIRPRQCLTPRFSRETTISSPKHDTYNRIPYNLRPHAFRVRLQYQAPTMSVVTFLAQDYNIRPRTWHLQFQTPRFSCELTISGPDNVWPHAFRARLQYQAPNKTPTILDPTLSCASTTIIINPPTFAKDSFFGQSFSRAHLWADIPAAWRGLFTK